MIDSLVTTKDFQHDQVFSDALPLSIKSIKIHETLIGILSGVLELKQIEILHRTRVILGN